MAPLKILSTEPNNVFVNILLNVFDDLTKLAEF
jgi:hypothetical protein